MYLFLTSRSTLEKHLIAAECAAMTGSIPDEDGIAIKHQHDSDPLVDISRSAYVKTCVKVIVYSSSFADLYDQLDKIHLCSEGFRVSVVKIPRNLPVDSQQIMHQVGARIFGDPDLSNPAEVFLVIATDKQIWLGQVVSESAGAWSGHLHKAHSYSSSLPSRFARAVVNLVSAPGEKIIDPCCGAGTILIEAVSMGIKAVGCDINPLMASAAVKNLRHFNLNAMVLIADARNMKGNFDAVVMDLPYGKNCPLDSQFYREILLNLKELATKAAVVTGSDISELLLQVKYDVKQVISVPKPSLTRYIHVVLC